VGAETRDTQSQNSEGQWEVTGIMDTASIGGKDARNSDCDFRK